MTTKFETYINLEDFKKKYLLDFSEDDRYDDFILYLKDLREYLHEFAYHITEGKYDYFTDNSGLDFDDVVSVIIPNKTLLNVYLQNDEFNDIDFLDLDSQRFNIVGQNHEVFYTFWHLNLLDMVEYIDNEMLKISIIGGDVIKMTQKQSTQKATSFEVPIYENLEDFKENYFADFTNQSESNFYQYLKNISDKYSEYISAEMEEDNKYNDKLSKFELAVLEKLEPLIPSDAYLLLFHDLWGNYSNEDDDAVFKNPNLFCDVIDFDWTDESKNHINRFFEIKKLQRDLRVEQQEFTLRYLKIIRHIEDEKKEIERTLKHPQQLQNSANHLTQLQLNAPKQIDNHNPKERGQNVPYKLAMLDEMGVIKQLNTKYTNKTDIYKILQFITGGNIDNVEDYYNSVYGNYSGNNQITEKHRAKAKDIYFK